MPFSGGFIWDSVLVDQIWNPSLTRGTTACQATITNKTSDLLWSVPASPKARLLEKDGAPLHIGGRALDILIFLAERPGEVVDKRDLIKQVWSDVNVDEGSLRFHITALRKVLGGGAVGARYVVNVPGRGYCFAAPLARAEPAPAPSTGSVSPVRSLPAPPAKMVGRIEAIEKIASELSQHCFVTIVGPGGIGKTSVAVAVGRRQFDALGEQVFLVDFGALTDVRLVPGSIASALTLLRSARKILCPVC